MRKVRMLCLIAAALVFTGGCSEMRVRENSSTAYAMVRDKFAAQQSYEFYGRTKVLSANSANGNMVNFSGRKDGTAAYMNIRRSHPEQSRAQTLSLLDQDGKKLYARLENDKDWREAGLQEAVLRQEWNNWDPAYAFAQMDEMKQRIIPLTSLRSARDVAAIEVVLDSAKLKKWLASQLREQQGARVQSAASFWPYQPSVKLAWRLTRGSGFAAGSAGAQVQSAPPSDLNEILKRMDVEAKYTIYYNKSSMLPTSITMSIRSAYNFRDQRVQEHSQVDTYLQNYGRAKPIPRPA